jgi:RNA polymerase sigma factor (sigma-70 family)
VAHLHDLARSLVVNSLAASLPSVAGCSPMPSFFPASRGQHSAAGAQFDAAIAALFRDEYGRVHRYLDRTLGDAHLATDIAQEAFVRLYDRGTMPDDPVAWLITVATNLLRDERRRTHRRIRLLERESGNVPQAAAAPDPSATVDRDEVRAQVRAALNRLEFRDREALLLRHSGYSYREIALILNLAETSVGTILLRAAAQFRATYQELHGDPD